MNTIKPVFKITTLFTAGVLCLMILLAEHPIAEESNDEKPPLMNMKMGPVVLFEEACARCHGSYGSMYGEEFANLDDEHLEFVVWDMMVGPSQLEVNDTEIDAMIEYHRAVREKVPFASLNNAEDIKTGEVSKLIGDKQPDVKVSIKKNKTVYETKDMTNEWQLDQAVEPPFTVIARRGEKKSEFTFPKSQWTVIESKKSESKNTH